MKNATQHIVTLIILTLCTYMAKAQDTICLNNSEQIVCTVTEIRKSEVEYLPWNDQNKNYHSVKTDLILFIKYQNGHRDTFNKIQVSGVRKSDTFANPLQARQAGFNDGFRYYNPQTERILGALSPPLLGFISVVVPIAISSSKVKAQNIGDAGFTNSKDQNYRNGYLEGANKRRKRAVWSSYGISIGSITVATVGTIWLFSL